MRAATFRRSVIFLLLSLCLIFGLGLYIATKIPTRQVSGANTGQKTYEVKIEESKSFSEILWSDPTAFFTMALAVFTAILALFTLGLLRETRLGLRDQLRVLQRQSRDTQRALAISRDAADAANLSARAALKTELPIIRAYPPELLQLDKPLPVKGPFGSGTCDLLPSPLCTVANINFRNSGRTAAFPIKIQTGWFVGKRLPQSPTFKHMARFAREEEASAFTIDAPRFTAKLAASDIEALTNGTVSFWFYIALHYEDFMDEVHEDRFCWVWGCPADTGSHHFYVDIDSPRRYRVKRPEKRR